MPRPRHPRSENVTAHSPSSWRERTASHHRMRGGFLCHEWLESLLKSIDLPNVGSAPLPVLFPESLDNLALERLVGRAVLHDLKITLEGKIDISQGGEKRLQQGSDSGRIHPRLARRGRTCSIRGHSVSSGFLVI